MANNEYPNKPLQPWVPKSMRDSGVNLDAGCGDIEQAESGLGLDHAVKLIGGTPSRAKDETKFTTQTTAVTSGPKPDVTMMSAAGKSLADVSAPSSSYEVHTKSTAAVKE